MLRAQVRFRLTLLAQALAMAVMGLVVVPWVCQVAQPGVPALGACVAKGVLIQAALGGALPMALLYTHEARCRRNFLAALRRG